jgi:hypothetical protein
MPAINEKQRALVEGTILIEDDEEEQISLNINNKFEEN